MTRCCDERPDPTVFGPCPHCNAAPAVERSFGNLYASLMVELTRTPTRPEFGLVD